MKLSMLFTALSFFVFFFAASLSGQITVEKKGMKKVYLNGGESIDSKELFSLLESNPSSVKDYKSSKTNSIVALSSIVCGTAFIGVGFYYTIKSAQAVGDSDLAGTTDYSNKSTNNILIGAGFYALSIPFLLLANSHLKKSINLYNASSGSGSIDDLELYFGMTDNGIGVGLSF